MRIEVSGLTLLGVVFVILKLAGIITWSWWWVTCPFWIGFAIYVFANIIVIIAIGLLAGFIELLVRFEDWKYANRRTKNKGPNHDYN